MEVVSEQSVSDSEAKEVLEKREKELGELKYEQKNSLDVLRKFVNLDSQKYKELAKELNKITKLREKHIVQIVNFLPENKDDLRAILHKDYTSFTEDEINLILETVKKAI